MKESLTSEQNTWYAVVDRLPPTGVKVLGYWKNELGKGRRTCVEYIAPLTRDGSCVECDDDTWFDCDESGNSFVPEGWYEMVEGSDDYPYTDIPITHWSFLQEPPRD